MSLNIHKDDLLRQGSQIGEKIGFEEGMHKGAYQAKIETAKILSTMHLSYSDIAKATGPAEAEIEKL